MSGRRFLVTGGTQGIGTAMVERARKAGHDVVFTGRSEARVQEIASKTGAFGLTADVSRSEDNARTVETCRERMGGVDVLVNNAGYATRGAIGSLDMDGMRRLFDVNVFGLVDLTNRVVPLMKEQQEGDIFNIASTSGMKGGANATAYAGSKWAVRGISQVWQAELRPDGIRVVCIVPFRGPDRFRGEIGAEQPEQALRGGHRGHDHGPARHASPGALARGRGLRDEPVEGGLTATASGAPRLSRCSRT